MEKARYQSRMRDHGYGEHDPIQMDITGESDVGTWDTLEKRWVKFSSGKWVPEDSRV